MSGLSEEVLEAISHARSLPGVPLTEPMVPYSSIAELFARHADRLEDAPFLIFYGDEGPRIEYSYREFYEEACKTANFLTAAGIAPGDRIATVSTNHADVVIQYFAAFLLGAVVVPINVGEDDARIRYVIQNSGVSLAFVRTKFLERVARIQKDAPGLRTIVQVGQKVDPRLPHFQTELSKQPTIFRPSSPNLLRNEALIVYTSGTTGHPKGVVLDQYNLLVDAMAIAEWHRLSVDQRMMCVLPLHHVNGVVVTLMTPLYAGGAIVLNERFHPDKFFERISAERVAVVSVVPTLLKFLLHSGLSMEAYKLASFRHIICGAGPLTVDLAMKFEQMFKIPIIHGYGLSETTCYSSFLPIDLPPADHRRWLSQFGFPSIGVPLSINEMGIQDESGRELDEGEKGEIVMRGHNVMKCYYQEPEVNRETFAGGWFHSGDEGFFRFDEQGRKFFFITGRIKEIIIRGGANISPFEIDEVLMTMPGIQAGIAVGFENEWYGEEVGAYVKVKDDMVISEEQVLAHCRRHLPFAKSPKVVVIGDDVPVTSTGKYQRNRCKELFAKWKTVQFTEPARH